MKWYGGFIEAEKGKGDYGSNHTCLFNQPATDAIALGLAASYAMEHGKPVQVFRGSRNLGRPWRKVSVNGEIGE